ncbi:MAG: phosphatase PAP2 family protein [Flavobacterium sp.]|uniref:phosphatase PAP2 family protein n=1 Tax=Flavobacterium sp. TaxID=239 RepID=UPI0022C88B53|nr:phosphatase PAP2 family protein [Flavobacterium sp.]MCZ8197098.1 phosphatase PAP2 family protein [Flavobacterium sp.]
MKEINKIDTEIFIFLNGLHNPFLDVIMFWASDKLFWVPFYIFLVVIIYREYKRRSIYVLITIALTIFFCDQTASHLFKPLVKRLRPSHEPFLKDIIHLSEAGPGGMYGFISSHATNVSGLATFLFFLLPRKYNTLKIILIFWACIVSYSRIYNGVHYPLDVICGMLVGLLYGYIFKMLLVEFNFLQSE